MIIVVMVNKNIYNRIIINITSLMIINIIKKII